MSIECPECGERVAALPIHKCRKGGDIQNELGKLRDWHSKTAVSRRSSTSRRRKAKHTAHAYLVNAAMDMIRRQDEAIATRDKTIARMRIELYHDEPFTDPDRPNYISR